MSWERQNPESQMIPYSPAPMNEKIQSGRDKWFNRLIKDLWYRFSFAQADKASPANALQMPWSD